MVRYFLVKEREIYFVQRNIVERIQWKGITQVFPGHVLYLHRVFPFWPYPIVLLRPCTSTASISSHFLAKMPLVFSSNYYYIGYNSYNHHSCEKLLFARLAMYCDEMFETSSKQIYMQVLISKFILCIRVRER